MLVFVSRFILREGFFDVGWKIGKFRYWILAALASTSVRPGLVTVAFTLADVSKPVEDDSFYLVSDATRNLDWLAAPEIWQCLGGSHGACCS